MAVNRDKPDRWKSDIVQSVDMYNQWFIRFAPEAFRNTRLQTTKDVENTLQITNSLMNISAEILRLYPGILPTLRMSTCPPLAIDRLIGLSGVRGSLKSMEEGKLPARMSNIELDVALNKVGTVIREMADRDIFVWLERPETATQVEIYRAATIVADRLCGAVANPIIRNAQEKRQLARIGEWLKQRGYEPIQARDGNKFDAIPPGTFSFRMNVPVKLEDGLQSINIPVDVVIMSKTAQTGDLPLLLEAKSAGDFTNVNKRRKEEAAKMTQLRHTYGSRVRFVLFLCGYFDTGYLGYEAAEGIDWVWEHRVEDLVDFGL